MHTYSIEDQLQIEKAIVFASSKFARCHNLIKPTLLHSIRVGSWLFLQGSDVHIVIAGLLHDIIEDTDATEQEIFDAFGEEVGDIVKANTKDIKIQDSEERNQELIQRCLDVSEGAAIVKAADIYDNYTYYTQLDDQAGIAYCKSNALYFRTFFKNNYFPKGIFG